MKLSDAIRKGCNGTAQKFEGWYDYIPAVDPAQSKVTGSCALGAAALGTFGPISVVTAIAKLIQTYPVLDTPRVECPACGVKNIDTTLMDVIMHLNDRHFWSRERIAGWLDEYGLSGSGESSVPKEEMHTTGIR